jgi:hypothetical protein
VFCWNNIDSLRAHFHLSLAVDQSDACDSRGMAMSDVPFDLVHVQSCIFVRLDVQKLGIRDLNIDL